MSSKNVLVLCGVIVLLFIAVVYVGSGVKTVQTGEIGVVKTFGVAKEIIQPGLHFLEPVSKRLEKYDTKTRQISFPLQAYSKDAQTVSGELSMQYQIQPERALDISREYGSLTTLEDKLMAIMQERTKSVFADKGAMALVETRAALSGEIQARIVPEMAQYHVTVKMVALSDISFNDAFESAVEQKMVSEQEKLRAEYEKEKAVIKAEEQLEVAKKQAEANVAKANGDAEALQIMQRAWSSLSSEVKDAMLRQMFYEQWNGELPQVMGGDNMGMILGENILTKPSATTPVQ